MIFILPVFVLKKCVSILRIFLWFGVGDAKRADTVAWELCHPKEEGGLGIKNMRAWNKAAIMQLGWEIVTRKESMWVRWCYQVLLKDKSFWAAKVTSICSWSWRRVLLLRDSVATRLVYSIGDGGSTSLWLDPWFNGVFIISRYGN
ncbi:hypothetical protein CFOL_v3_28544 [Cephalotus follicularis]|uniref:Zf-RVT domain-containing protein n=1 Tax=Cephalotus follicularis TaxID=3775 RepID=A0A1Q3CY81_CEPFO|nr:hypothetical protein CFOL_v3_28544 [Cephalotus follicularis]